MSSTRPPRRAAEVALRNIRVCLKLEEECDTDELRINTLPSSRTTEFFEYSNKIVNKVWYNPSSAAVDRPFLAILRGCLSTKSWTLQEAYLYLGQSITQWLQARPMETLDFVTAWRWGLSQMQQLEEEQTPVRVSTAPWEIIRIVLGDGRDGFEKDCYYASSVPSSNGSESFYKILFCTLASTAEEGSISNEDTTVVEEDNGILAIFIGRETIQGKLDRIDGWARRHRGCILRLGPGSCGFSQQSKTFYVRTHGPVFCRTNGDNCAFAGVLNALCVLDCNPTAKRLVGSANPPMVRDFTDLSRWMRCYLPEFQLLGGRKNRIKLGDVDTSNGVFLFHIVGSNVADHVVVFDAQTILIYDSEEAYPMNYNHASLSSCVGDDEYLLEVREIRQLVLNI